MSVSNGQIVGLLQDVLFETPSLAAANARYWAQLSSPDTTIVTLGALMASSQEATIAQQVVRYYMGALDRSPSGDEVAYYTAVAEAGLTPLQIRQGEAAVPQARWNQIASAIVNSPEFASLYAGHDLVTALFQNVLGRDPSASDIAFYQAQLAAGANASLVMQEIVNCPEYRNGIDGPIAHSLGNYGPAVVSGATRLHLQLFDCPSPGVAYPLAGPNYAAAPALAPSWSGELIFVSDPSRLAVDSEVVFGVQVTSPAQAVAALEAGIGAHHVRYGSYGGNTFIVASATGAPGPADTTVIGLVGVHDIVSPGPGTIEVVS